MDTPCRNATPKLESIRDFTAEHDFEEKVDIAYYLAVSTCMRHGEICGLSWRELDLENKAISICHSYDRLNSPKKPKAQDDIRRLPMQTSYAAHSGLPKTHSATARRNTRRRMASSSSRPTLSRGSQLQHGGRNQASSKAVGSVTTSASASKTCACTRCATRICRRAQRHPSQELA